MTLRIFNWLYIKISIKKEKNKIKLSIADHGLGMSDQQLEKLGLPFYSTKEEGTGIGMLVCFQIVEAMNGKIDVESVLGKGTTFTLTFHEANSRA